MENYLHLFETEQEFNAQYEGSGYTEPWVSYTMETSAVSFNKGGGGHDYSQDYFTFEILTGGNITWSYWDDDEGDFTDATKTIYYSKNDGEWTEMSRTLSVDAGDVIRFKGDNDAYSDSEFDYNSFINSTAVFNAKGNIMSLISSSNFTSLTALTTAYTFCQFLVTCEVVDASNLVLPATILGRSCYFFMFEGCTSLTSAPALPATTLAETCYGNMFEGCTSLTQAPELPATTLANDCYTSMFSGCQGLTSAPALPATTLASNCYYSMFNDCTGLTSAPALPATTLASGCYNFMFSFCTSLTSAPELPATTLVNDCYSSMFADCTNLNYVKCLATDVSASDCTTDWLYDASSTGTVVTPSSTQWITGISGIPTGWTRVDA